MESEQDDGLSQKLEQELEQKLGLTTLELNFHNNRVREKLMSDIIESVSQAVGVRSDRRCRRVTFGIDTAACRMEVPARHPATRGTRQWASLLCG